MLLPFSKKAKRLILYSLWGLTFLIITATFYQAYESRVANTKLKAQETKVSQELAKIKNEDQFKRNEKLQAEIKSIEETYKQAVTSYEQMLKLNAKSPELETQFAKVLSLLSQRNYSSASSELTKLNSDIQKKQAEIASSFKIPENVPVNNSAPGAGYRRQTVQNEFGTYLVDVVAADLNSSRVIVDTASDGDCRDGCPVLPLGTYASRNGAIAAINGPYFCPAEYPSCAGKTNSFDTLLMNKNKVYFNSANNVYSGVPLVVFSGNSARYLGRSQDWGRDTGVDAVIANQPLLVSGGNVVFGGDDEAKRAGKGSRSFIGSTGSTVYIGVVHNANVAEVARVLKTMGIENALNLDSGGSTALMSGGRYVVGPGRSLPFGILIVGK